MASNVFPMLSSSPPPIDDCPDDDDDDDEFGNFTAANIPFDSSFDSPVAVEKFKSYKSGDNGVNNSNFSDEINKFSFSNSTTPSPQEFVPNFPNETERTKNGFKPIKNELCDSNIASVQDSSCQIKTEIASHKPVPSVPSEHLAHSLNDSEPLSSKGCDIQENTVIKSSNNNDHRKSISKDSVCESDLFDGKPLPVSNLLKDPKDSSYTFHEKILNDSSHQSETCISHSYTNFGISKENKDLNEFPLQEDSGLSIDKFDCSFNLEDSNNDFENFADFQHPGDLFPSNDHSTLDSKFSTAFDESNSETKPESAIGKFSDDDLSDNEFEFHAFRENAVSNESSETVLKSNFNNDQKNENSDNEFDNFQTCKENTTSAQVPENSEVVLTSTFDDKQADEFSDYEFDDFQGCAERVAFTQAANTSLKSDREDFDDFQEFQFSDAQKEDADDFADFQDFNAENASSADDFADFSSVPFESNKISEPPPDESDFADFKEADFNTPTEASPQSTSVAQKSIDTLSTVINAIFPVADTPENCDISDETSPQILEQSNKSRRLWEKLHEVEQAPGLRFQWGVSHSFQQLLRAVNVDYHSILRTSSVPIFASGLSLLEPVKGLSSSANHESEDRNQIPKDSIPPVEFDWISSGLVNPLDHGQNVSTLLDLSFLSSVGSGSKETNNDNSFESELLKPSPAFVCPESNSQTHILEQLLSKNVSSLPNSKLSRRPSDLSDEAIRVLDQLPDLSFMQAKVLMFPISSKT